LRDLGYKNRIILHLQNDHLGHWTSEMLDELETQLNAVVTCSGYLRNTFAPKSKALANKTTVIFNGVNTGLFHPRENLREPQTIFFVGRFHSEKGILQLVQAYSRVLRNYAEAKLVIGGTTGFGTHNPDLYVREVEAVARSIQQGDPKKIQFTGYLHHERDLPGWFQRAGLFASPSIFEEPFGLVNAEAMACATAVIGARRGGIPEVLGDTGILVDPEDIQEFAEAISTLLGDRAYAARLGSAACQRARQTFDWSIIAKRWIDFLAQLMDSA
jgi:spore coat protein SA